MAQSVYQTRQIQAQAEREAVRLTILSEVALSHIQAKSLAEVQHSRHLKETYDLQLELMKKTHAKEIGLKKQAAKDEEPVYVHTDDGREVNLNDFDVMS